jgi:hypothetical protein
MEATDLARKTEEIAARDVGQRENPSNRGPRIDQYQAYTSIVLGSAYCASACSLWVHEAAIELSIIPQFQKSGSALHLWANNPDLQFTTLTPADLPCVGINEHDDHIHGHAFLIVGMDEATGQLQTIDPNSDPHGSREGTGVWQLNVRNTADAQRKGYLRIQ